MSAVASYFGITTKFSESEVEAVTQFILKVFVCISIL